MNRLRISAGIIFGMDPRLFSRSASKTEADIVKMVKWRTDDLSYPRYPPVLYADFQHDDSKRFRNPMVHKVRTVSSLPM